jgi:hypothetical protein
MVVLEFSLLWQIPEKNNLKGRIIYFDSWFQRIQSRVSWTHCFAPEARQNIMAAGMWNCFTPHGSQEAERQRSTKDKIYSSRTCLHWPMSSNKGFTSENFHHRSIMSSIYESVSGLVNWWRQRLMLASGQKPQYTSLSGRHFRSEQTGTYP